MTLEVALGSRRATPGYFLPRPSHSAAPAVTPPDGTAAGLALVSSYRGHSTLKATALRLIEEANRTIFLASYFIGDDDLLAALLRAAERLRGGVYIVTAMSDDALAQGLAEVDESDPAAKQARAKQFGSLVERGLAVRGHDDCHAKFLIIDSRVALVSTANFDTPGFEKTTELAAVVHDPGEVQRLRQLFGHVWRGSTWEMRTDPSYALARRSVPDGGGEWPAASGALTETLWTAPGMPLLWQRLEKLVASARRRLLLSTFSLRGLAKRPGVLLNGLRAFAASSGAAPQLLMRARNHMEAARQDAEALVEAGVDILADDFTHLKAIVVDGRAAAIFSANLEVERGLLGGVEVGVSFVDPPAVASLERFMTELLAAAPYAFRPSPTVSELARAAPWLDAWPLDPRVRVTCEDAAWEALRSSAPDAPALFEEDGEGIRLSLGKARVVLSRPQRGTPTLCVEQDGVPSGLVLGRWLHEGQVDGHRRGVCDATFERVLRASVRP